MNISEEIIDSFLRGDLTGAELENFNKALGADPKLQQEVSFQQDIVDSIKQYRHNQLKSRLNSIEVSPLSMGSATSIYFKLAASIGVVALLIGSFALFNNTSTDDTSVSASVSETPKATQSTTLSGNTEANSSASTTPAEQKTTSSVTANAASKEVSTSNATLAKKSDTKNSTTNSSANTNQTTVNTLLPGDEEMVNEDMTFNSRSENFSTPTMTNTDHSSISASVVKVNIVKEKNLAYRYFNNELYLHGNFSNSTYELFEMNNKPTKHLFLYFEDNYYELIQGKTKVTDLVPITDKAVLLQLAQLREH